MTGPLAVLVHAVPVQLSLVPQGLFGFAVGPLVKALFSYLTSWVAAGAAALVAALGHVLQTTGGPDLGGGLASLMGRTLAIGFALCLPMVLLAVIQGIVRQEPGLALRAVLIRLPLAGLLGVGALDIVRLAVAATDQMSAGLLDSVSGDFSHLVSGLANGLSGGGSAALGLPGFGLLVLAFTAAAVAFLLWIELVVRSAAIEVATLFLPLVLAGLIWPATAHWARRLAETLAALVLSKVVIAGVLALSVATTQAASPGPEAAVQGVALLLLAACSPYALLRLIPVVEAGSMGHLDGLARRGLQAASSVVPAIGAHLPGGSEPFDAAALLSSSGGRSPAGAEHLGFLPAHFDQEAFDTELATELTRLGPRRDLATAPAPAGQRAVADETSLPGGAGSETGS